MFICCRRLFAIPKLTPSTGAIIVPPVGVGDTGTVVFVIGFGGGVGGVVGGAIGRVPFGFTGMVLFPIGANIGPVGVAAFLVELIGCVTFVGFVILLGCGVVAFVVVGVGVGVGVGVDVIV